MIEQRKRNRGQGGFTLIELLVVIAILAVLAGIAVFAVGNLTEGADESACKTEKDTLNTAVQAAIAKNGDDGGFQQYLDGTLKYWSYTPTVAVNTSSNDPVGANTNAGNAVCT